MNYSKYKKISINFLLQKKDNQLLKKEQHNNQDWQEQVPMVIIYLRALPIRAIHKVFKIFWLHWISQWTLHRIINASKMCSLLIISVAKWNKIKSHNHIGHKMRKTHILAVYKCIHSYWASLENNPQIPVKIRYLSNHLTLL